MTTLSKKYLKNKNRGDHMITVNRGEIPYIIEKNNLHVFDIGATCAAIAGGRIDLSKGSISSLRLYAFSTVIWYNSYTNKSVRMEHDIDYLYDNFRFIIKYFYRNNTCTARHSVTIYKTSYYDDIVTPIVSVIQRELSAMGGQPRLRVVGLDREICNDIWECTYPAQTYQRKHNQKIYVSVGRNELRIIIDDAKCFVSDRDLPLVLRSSTSMYPIVTVEDYVKWYDLYIVDGDTVCKSYDMKDDRAFAHDVDWVDHAPEPASVVRACKKHGMKLDYCSYVAICCRWIEDTLEEPTELLSVYLSPGIDLLNSVLVSNGRSFCLTYGIPLTTHLTYEMNQMIA